MPVAVVVLGAGLSCPQHGTGALVPQPPGSTRSTLRGIAACPHPLGRIHPTHRSMMLLLNRRSHVTDFICSRSSCILPDTQRGTYTGAAQRPPPAGEAEAMGDQQGCPKPWSLSWDDTGQPLP